MTKLTTVGLFAGIAGIEKGLEESGHKTLMFSEIDTGAQAVLSHRYPNVPIIPDVRDVPGLPQVDLVSAGFPCTDISQAGRKAGINGPQSSMIGELWRLLSSKSERPHWLLIENVSYLLSLDRGNGLKYLIDSVEHFGYRWAYRIVDARAFGVPQRRQRVIFLASQSEDPREIIFADNVDNPLKARDDIGPVNPGSAYGFYWTEGIRGLGWTHDAVPTIKGGSGLGIPSAPAIWLPDQNEFGTPQIKDAERLQGFPEDWTISGTINTKRVGNKSGSRWKQVGNAVCVPMSRWVGERLRNPKEFDVATVGTEFVGPRWPRSAYGFGGRSWKMEVSDWPMQIDYSLRTFLEHPLLPLSLRATNGFYSRATKGQLRFPDGFLDAMREYRQSTYLVSETV